MATLNIAAEVTGTIWKVEVKAGQLVSEDATLLIVEGLAAAGEMELAREIARRFCDMCAKHGFAENFNALTGQPLRDPAYTWTSSVFLILAHEYLREEA